MDDVSFDCLPVPIIAFTIRKPSDIYMSQVSKTQILTGCFAILPCNGETEIQKDEFKRADILWLKDEQNEHHMSEKINENRKSQSESKSVGSMLLLTTITTPYLLEISIKL